MTVLKPKGNNKSWVVVVYIGRDPETKKKIRHRHSFKTKEEAESSEQQLKADLRASRKRTTRRDHDLERRIFEFASEFVGREQRLPSRSEVAIALDISRSRAQTYLVALEKAGKLRQGAYQWRAHPHRPVGGEVEASRGAAFAADIQSFSELLEDLGYSRSTIRGYQTDVARFARYLETRQVNSWADLSPQLLLNYLEILARRRKKSTIHRASDALSIFIWQSHGDVKAGRDLIDCLPHHAQVLEPDFLSLGQVQALLAATYIGDPLADRDKAIIEVMYATGARVSELAELNVGDVGSSTLVFRGYAPREILLPVPALKAVNNYLENGRRVLERRSTQSALFLNWMGRRLSDRGFRVVLNRYESRVDNAKRLSPKTLRHTFAMHHLSAGLSTDILRELLGSKSKSMVWWYKKWTADNMLEDTLNVRTWLRERYGGSLPGETS